jgi:hypothetical protein
VAQGVHGGFEHRPAQILVVMAPSFVACDREQPFLLPPDVRDWLPEDHFAWFVIDAVDGIYMAAFYAAYRDDGRCRPALSRR